MEIRPRQCLFKVFRPGACMATLVCEDLGRMEPVQTALRAIGPNLVICLLMDGPQMEQRWPNRYAMVLADDPGCSVLSFTSIGLMRRTPSHAPIEHFKIALWKERNGPTCEIKMPNNAQGLVLTLWPSQDTDFTADGRSDHNSTMKLTLAQQQTICLPPLEQPEWLRVLPTANITLDPLD